MSRVVVQEFSFRRLIIDIDPFIRDGNASLVFDTEDSARTVGLIVESWITKAKDAGPVGIGVRFLPDLILSHADEWGLQ